MRVPRGLYIHVPLCKSKCVYCDFYSLPESDALAAAYVESLLAEIKLKGQIWGGPVETVYFGGGTPSCLSLEQAAAILKECGRFFSWCQDAEVTFEINPGTVDAEYLRGLRALGVNRLSIGLQAHQDHHLLRLGRAHHVADFSHAVESVQRAGFSNFSVDAIYGLPEQTLQEYLKTLACITESGATHVSVYALQVEPNTPLYSEVAEGRIVVPDEDLVAEMMLTGRELLLARGYVHYEISNYALPGHYARHNTLYWRNHDYVGLGPGASSYIAGRRFSNIPDLATYSLLVRDARMPVAACERVKQAEAMAETMMLGLRMLDEGVNRTEFARRFGRDPVEVYGAEIEKHLALGLLDVSGSSVRLTSRGFPIASQVQISFLP